MRQNSNTTARCQAGVTTPTSNCLTKSKTGNWPDAQKIINLRLEEVTFPDNFDRFEYYIDHARN